jgi:hypothetical protein
VSIIGTVQELLGYKGVETTIPQGGTHVLNRGGRGVDRSLDGLRMPVSGEPRGIRRGDRSA